LIAQTRTVETTDAAEPAESAPKMSFAKTTFAFCLAPPTARALFAERMDAEAVAESVLKQTTVKQVYVIHCASPNVTENNAVTTDVETCAEHVPLTNYAPKQDYAPPYANPAVPTSNVGRMDAGAPVEPARKVPFVPLMENVRISAPPNAMGNNVVPTDVETFVAHAYKTRFAMETASARPPVLQTARTKHADRTAVEISAVFALPEISVPLKGSASKTHANPFVTEKFVDLMDVATSVESAPPVNSAPPMDNAWGAVCRTVPTKNAGQMAVEETVANAPSAIPAIFSGFASKSFPPMDAPNSR